MEIFYLPPNRIVIDGTVMEFNEERELIRSKLEANYIEDNQVMQIGDSLTDLIYQRRDIFKNINSTDNYFFLGYDENDLLIEVEVHNCDKIKVIDFVFDFNDELDIIASGLSKYSFATQKSEGEYFFNDIKVSIINKSQMGAEGSTLGYFYCAKDVTHLED
jgi:hypothetical protein